jgi:glycosyltransferase involved in cell wall biosynthesis
MAHALSIVIPWCNRSELGSTLRRNAEAFQSLDAEVLIVNCGGDAQALEPLVRASDLPCPRLLHVRQGRFNKCLALNIGTVFSQGPRLLFLDADIVITPAVLAGLVDRTDERAFATIQWVVDSDATTRPSDLAEFIQRMELAWTDGERMSFEFFRSRGADHARGGPGLICALKEHLLAVDGMNSRLTSWGWEDLDLIVRLQAVHKIDRVLFGEALHLAHDDTCRSLTGTTRHESTQRNMSICYGNYGRRHFLGTLRHDVTACREKVIEHGSAVAHPAL